MVALKSVKSVKSVVLFLQLPRRVVATAIVTALVVTTFAAVLASLR